MLVIDPAVMDNLVMDTLVMDTLTCLLPTSCVVPVYKSPKDYPTYRISPGDTNRLALVFDPTIANMSLTYCVEIFDVGGKTPPNRHQVAVEMFFVLKGEGRATCDGKSVAIGAGDSILVPPNGVHVVENTGLTRLYTLCIMVPNEDFAELIRSGTPVELDDEDLAVLGRYDASLASAQ
jgi:mannose-6-phosphate isomerase-like protein (cupin superfamily)